MTALRVLSMVTAASALLFAAPVRAQDCSGGVFFASAAVVGGSAIYDIATASKSARRYNERHVSVAARESQKRVLRRDGVVVDWPLEASAALANANNEVGGVAFRSSRVLRIRSRRVSVPSVD